MRNLLEFVLCFLLVACMPVWMPFPAAMRTKMAMRQLFILGCGWCGLVVSLLHQAWLSVVLLTTQPTRWLVTIADSKACKGPKQCNFAICRMFKLRISAPGALLGARTTAASSSGVLLL